MAETSHYTREDIQHVADIRLIALAKLRRFQNDQRFTTGASRMRTIILACEEVIGAGPPQFHHILERTLTTDEIQQELRQSVFGGALVPGT